MFQINKLYHYYNSVFYLKHISYPAASCCPCELFQGSPPVPQTDHAMSVTAAAHVVYQVTFVHYYIEHVTLLIPLPENLFLTSVLYWRASLEALSSSASFESYLDFHSVICLSICFCFFSREAAVLRSCKYII